LNKAAPLRVLILTQWFDPEPTFKGLVFARELVRLGFEVEVLTGFPNYPGGKVYAGYKIKWLQKETIDGVSITRVPLYPNHGQSAIKRVMNYLSFAVSALFHGFIISKRVNVIYAYHPPLTVGIVACIIRFFRRIPVVYDVQDMWPDTLRATGMVNSSRLLKLVEKVCQWVYRRVDQIVVLSPGFKKLLVERGVPENKIEIIYNWADEVSLLKPNKELPLNFPQDNKFNIIFAGNMGKAQAISTLIDSAIILEEKKSLARFIMIGGGVEVNQLKRRVDGLQLKNVIFMPSVPMNEVGAVLCCADVLIVHLRKDPLFEITIPSKTQAYMAVGKPLLMAVEGDAANLVIKSGGGLVVEPENSLLLVDAIESLISMPIENLNDMGQRAKNFYDVELSLKVGVEHFASLFRKIVCKP
jgi:glycosyltransferase involved in cell wall biosynthesis